MASNRQSPLWNQDAIMAAGLAFAGMAVLQSTLLRDSRIGAWWAGCLEVLGRFVNWHVVAWWPAMLIVAGVMVWWRSVRQNRRRQSAGSEVPMGGSR